MKPIKVFFNGKRLKDVYPHATAFQVFKYRVRCAIRWTITRLMLTAGIAAILLTGYFIGTTQGHELIAVQNAVAPKAFASETLEAKLATSKDDLVESLGLLCETKGAKEPDATIILDTNNEMSIGSFQFQIKTVQHYFKVLYQKEISRVEAIQIAIDHKRAAALTKDILFTVPNGYGNWAICAAKLQLPIQIAVLNKLNK